MNPLQTIANLRYKADKLGVKLEGIWLNEEDTKELGDFLYKVAWDSPSLFQMTMFQQGIINEPFLLFGITIHSVKTS
jgi:hypothetical protein